MPTSQNGYPCNDRSLIITLTVPGTNVQLPVRKGACGQLLLWAATRWHHEVEPLIQGTCWAYAERTIRGSSDVMSNHASGTAIDLNAPKHPLGTTPSSNFTAAQIQAIHRIIADAKGALRWGGDYGDVSHGGISGSRFDGMHVEIDAPEAEVAAVLAEVNGAGDDMPANTVQQIDEIHEQLLSQLKAWGGGVTDSDGTPYTALQFLLRSNVETHQVALMCQQLLKLQKDPSTRQVQLHEGTVDEVVDGVHAKLESTVADITHRAVVDEMATAGFWASAAERAAKTFAQTALVLFGAGPLDVLSIAWETTLSLSAGAALVSILTSLASAQTGAKGTPSLVKERN